MLLKTEDRNCDSRAAGMIGVFEVEEFTRGVIYICLRQMDSRLSFMGKTKNNKRTCSTFSKSFTYPISPLINSNIILITKDFMSTFY